MIQVMIPSTRIVPPPKSAASGGRSHTKAMPTVVKSKSVGEKRSWT